MLFFSTDINECANVTAVDCDVNADCIDIPGSYLCECKPGFQGNGKTCFGKKYNNAFMDEFVTQNDLNGIFDETDSIP